MTRLAILEPETLARLGYAAALTGYPDLILAGHADTPDHARQLLTTGDTDLLIVNQRLPADDGLAVAAQLKTEHPHLAVVLTGPADDDLLLHARDHGLTGYLPDTTPLRDMVTTWRQAATAPTGFTSPGLATALARQQARTAVLSRREQQILHDLHNGHTLAEIAMHLHLSESSVHTYLDRMCQKLHVPHWRSAVAAATERGLL